MGDQVWGQTWCSPDFFCWFTRDRGVRSSRGRAESAAGKVTECSRKWGGWGGWVVIWGRGLNLKQMYPHSDTPG